MRKFIRIFMVSLGWALVGVIFMPILAAVLLVIPPVQRFAVAKAVGVISRNLETTVSIERLSIKNFSDLTVKGIYIEDYQRDTLLYAEQISANMNLFDIIRNPSSLAFGRTKLEGCKLRLVKYEGEDDLNIAQIIRRISKPRDEDTPSDFRLDISSVSVSDMQFILRNKERSNPASEGMIDFSNIVLDQFNFGCGHLSMIGDSIIIKNVSDFSFRERSGLDVERFLSSKLTVTDGNIEVRDVLFDTAESNMRFDFVRLVTDGWQDYSDFTNRVRIEGEMSKSVITTKTLGYFAPALAEWNLVFRDAVFDFSGTVAQFGGSIENMKTGGASIVADFRINGLPDITKTSFDINIANFTATADDVAVITESITGQTMSTVQGYLSALGAFTVTGRFSGMLDNFNADAGLRTNIGDILVTAGMSRQSGNANLLNASVTAEDLDVGYILDINDLGRTSLEAQIAGLLAGKSFAFDTKAQILYLDYNDYQYRDIRIDGEVNEKSFEGRIESRDPNLQVSFDGTVNLTDSIPCYKAAVELYRADLHAIKLNNRDSVSVIRCSIDLDASGRTLDDLNGTITVDNFQYTGPNDTIRSGRITLTGRNSANSKLLSLTSPLIDAEFRSRTSYRQTYDYAVNTLQFYMPTLAYDKRKSVVYDPQSNETDMNNYSMINLEIKQDNAVAGLFVPGLHVAAGTNLRFVFNPASDAISLSAASEYIDFGDIFIANLDVTARNVEDSLTFYLNAIEVDYGSMSFPNFSVIGGARHNNLSMTTGFFDPAANSSAFLNIIASLTENPQTRRPAINVRFDPSQFSNNGTHWRIFSRNILIDSANISIDNFRIYSDNQDLTVNGIVSGSAYDTLNLNLSRFDLSIVNQFIKNSPYILGGTLTGYAEISSALKGGSLLSRIDFDDLAVNDIKTPPLQFESHWDFANAMARLSVSERVGNERLITGYYAPADRSIMADIEIENINLALINPLFEDIIHTTSGSADTNMQLSGTIGAPVLNGNIVIREFITTLDFTNAAYRIPLSEMVVENNQFTLRPATLFDSEGNTASLDIRFDFRNFRNPSYELNVRPTRFIAMNTGVSNNELFFGKIYATGSVSVRGSEAGVNIDIVATPEDNSTFTMQMGGKSDIHTADFVNIINRTTVVEREPTPLERRREQYERRNEKNSVRSNMNINMAITATPAAEFNFIIDPTMGGSINGRGSGFLNLHINPTRNEFSMYGGYVISEGNYLFTLQNIINKRFRIDAGSSITWTGDPTNAILDVTATYSLRASLAPLSAGANKENFRRMVPVECRVRLSDNLSKPAFTFDIHVPNADPETRNLVANAINTQEMMTTQVLFLLATGSFYTDASGLMQNIGTMGGASLAIDYLSGQLSNMLSNDRFDIGIRYRPMSELGSDEFGLDFSAEILGGRLRIEGDGNYDLQNNNSIRNRNSNLSGNFYLISDLNRRGNLRAKAFTRTIERYDENMGTQENGMGIYFNDDFSTFRELIRKFGAIFGIRSRRTEDEINKTEYN